MSLPDIPESLQEIPRRSSAWVLPDSPDHPAYEMLLEAIEKAPLEEGAHLFRMACVNDFYFFVRHCLSLGQLKCNDPYLKEWYGRPWLDHRWLFDRCRELQAEPDGKLDLWPRFHFKGLALDTEVPTPDGWREHGDLKVGDKVFARDGSPATVVGVSEVKNIPCFRIHFDDGTSVVADEDHQWIVEKKSYRRTATGREGSAEVVMSSRGLFDYRKTKTEPYLRVPQGGEAQYEDADLPIPPYVLGIWLGDGTTASGGVTSADEEVWYSLREFGYELGPLDKKGITRTVLGLRPQLRKLGVLGNKHIPTSYMTAGIEQRRELVQGLMDSDGTVHKAHGQMTFCNSNEVLCAQLRELLASLGVKSHYYHRENGFQGHGQVCLQASPEKRIFRLKRKADRVRPAAWKRDQRRIVAVEDIGSVPTSCIMVDHPTSAYLVGRNYVVTHNTSLITQSLTLWEFLVSPDLKVGIGTYKVDTTGEAMVTQMKLECERNEKMKWHFPYLFYWDPEKESPEWTMAKFRFKQSGNPKEPSVMIFSVIGALPTSFHFDVIVLDDMVTERSIDSADAIEKTTEGWRRTAGIGGDATRRRHVGTHWAHNDTYRYMLDAGAVELRYHDVFHPDTEIPVLRSKEWVFGDGTPQNIGQRLIMGPKNFAAQIRNRPSLGTVHAFEPSWLRYYNVPPAELMQKVRRYLLIDTSASRSGDADYNVLMVVGLMRGIPQPNIYLLDMEQDQMNLATLTDKIFELVEKWRPSWSIIEQVGAVRDIEHMRMAMQERAFSFRLQPYDPRIVKENRIERLQIPFEQGRIYLPRNLWKMRDGRKTDLIAAFLHEQFNVWTPSGGADRDDVLDTLSMTVAPELSRYLRPPDSAHAAEFDRYYKPETGDPYGQSDPREGLVQRAWAY